MQEDASDRLLAAQDMTAYLVEHWERTFNLPEGLCASNTSEEPSQGSQLTEVSDGRGIVKGGPGFEFMIPLDGQKRGRLVQVFLTANPVDCRMTAGFM